MKPLSSYDTILMGNFFAYPEFQQKFGVYFPPRGDAEGKWEVEGKWQVALNMGSTVGGIFGKPRAPPPRPSAGTRD